MKPHSEQLQEAAKLSISRIISAPHMHNSDYEKYAERQALMELGHAYAEKYATKQKRFIFDTGAGNFEYDFIADAPPDAVLVGIRTIYTLEHNP